MTVAPDPEEPSRLAVFPPKEALRRARPLPNEQDMVIDGLTDAEWTAFEKALAER